MAHLFTLSTGTVQALGWQAETNQYRNCAELVQKLCSCSGLCKEI